MKQPIRFDPRERSRCRLQVPAVVTTSDGTLKVHVLDLSGEGFGATCSGRISRGHMVTLQVPEIGLVPARVMWTRAERFGAKFLRPFDLRRCRWTVGLDPRSGTDRRVERRGG